MSLLRWAMGGDSDHVTGLNWDTGLVGHRKIPAWQRAKLPRYRREGAVEVRPFPAKTRLRASKAQGLSREAVKGNPTTTVIPRVDESKSSPSNNRRLDRTDRSEGILPQTYTILKNREASHRSLSSCVSAVSCRFCEPFDLGCADLARGLIVPVED
jgi:hypothetical protein